MATTPTFQNQLLVSTFSCALVTNYMKPGVSLLLKLAGAFTKICSRASSVIMVDVADYVNVENV